MSGHTPEPWRTENAFGEGELDVAIDYDIPRAGNPVVIASVFDQDEFGICPATRTEALANAKRIVACVNACAGIPTEQLEAESVADQLDRWQRECSSYIAEIEQLREQPKPADGIDWDKVGPQLAEALKYIRAREFNVSKTREIAERALALLNEPAQPDQQP